MQKPGHVLQVAAGAGGAAVVGEEIEHPAVPDVEHLGVLAAHLQEDEMVQARQLPGPQEMGPDLGDGREMSLQEILAVAGDHQGLRLRQPQAVPIDRIGGRYPEPDNPGKR